MHIEQLEIREFLAVDSFTVASGFATQFGPQQVGTITPSPIPRPTGSMLRYIPDDPYYQRYQWQMKDYDLPAGIPKGSNVEQAWDFMLANDNGDPNDPDSFAFGDGVLIAFVDTGAQWDHPETGDRNVRFADGGNCDFTQDPTRCLAPIIDPFIDIHGTAVVGLAMAGRDDGRGLTGVSPDAHWIFNQILPTFPAGTRAGDIAESNGLRPRTIACGGPTGPVGPMETRLGDEFVSVIDIFNNSWGPVDGVDWRTPNAIPGPQAQAAIDCGTEIGSIYVWAAGNGGAFGDNINYDQFANSRKVISVGSIDVNGKKSIYSEPGASLLVVAPSASSFDGNGGVPPEILTTDWVDITLTPQDLISGGDEGGYNYHLGEIDPRNPAFPPDNDPFDDPSAEFLGLEYTSFGHYSATDPQGGFGGTSASAPIVSGVIAMMLDVNPTLTYRDVQHILVRSTWKNDGADGDWATNKAGFEVNHKYGFGAIDALQAVNNASVWPGAGPMQTFSTGRMTVLRAPTDPQGTVGRIIPDNAGPIAQLFNFSTDCFDTVKDLNCELNGNPIPDGYDGSLFPDLEWIEVILETDHQFAGDLDVTLYAPDANGQPGQFRSILATEHASGENYDNWVFTTARHWGEKAKGQWRIEIRDRETGNVGNFVSWQMNFYGSSIPPIALNDATSASSGVLKLINVLNNDSGAFVASTVQIVPNTLPTGHTATPRPDGRIAYTSPAGFVGTIAFQYIVRDSAGQPSNPATVTVNVLPFNPAPIAGNDNAVTTFATPVTIDLLANDVDPPPDSDIDPSSVSLIQPPPASIGTVSAPVNGVVTFTPAAGFQGVATFKYIVRDTGGRSSNTATVTITVGPPPPALPTATNDTVAAVAGQSILIDLLANDFAASGAPPIDRSSVVIATFPTEGFVGAPDANGRVFYTAPPGFPGTAIFQYYFFDTDGRQSSTATVFVNVNAAPFATADTVTTDEESIILINVLGNDFDDDPDGFIVPSTLQIVSPPSLGTATIDAATRLVRYTPSCDATGTDTFTYNVRDNLGQISNTATVTVIINEANDAPLANDDVAGTALNTPVIIRPWENDTDADSATDPLNDVDNSTSVVPFGGGPQNGTLTYNMGTFEYTYTPNPGFMGLDRFQYFVRDTTGRISNLGTAWIRVGPAVGINGFVYADPNNNGLMDPGEIGLSGVLVQATLNTGGIAFTQTVRTDATGRYEFVDNPNDPERPIIMPPGTYTIRELQPGFLTDGKDTAGTPAPTLPPSNDQFSGVVLAAGQTAANYNFGEFQLLGSFTVNHLSSTANIATASLDDGVSDSDPFASPRPTTGNISGKPLNLANGSVWFSFDEGLSGRYFIEAVSNDGAVRLSVFNNNNLSTPVATSGASPTAFARVEFNGTSAAQFLRVSGTGSDYTLRMGLVDECSQTVAPPTAEVLISGTDWSPSFTNFLINDNLGNGGYRIPAGQITQFDPIPWSNVNQISIRFSQPTTVAQSSLVVTGFNHGNYAINGFSYDTASDTATWRLSTPIEADRVLLDLTTPQGNFDLGSLTEDGELLRFNVLPADVTRNGTTSFQDTIAVNNRIGQTTVSAAYSALFDVDGSGSINATDRTLTIAHGFTGLPVGQPPLPAGPSPSAPSAVIATAGGGSDTLGATAIRTRDARISAGITARARSQSRAAATDSAFDATVPPESSGDSSNHMRARRMSRGSANASAIDEALASI
jgi:subtilisin-like proprotein convertase family protein